MLINVSVYTTTFELKYCSLSKQTFISFLDCQTSVHFIMSPKDGECDDNDDDNNYWRRIKGDDGDDNNDDDSNEN